MNSVALYAVGFIAQALFSSRLIVQWVSSEKAEKVVSPTLFWVLSLCASCVMMIYGFFRLDIVIILGQLIGYYIYIRNLMIKNEWAVKLHIFFQIGILLLPMMLLGYLLFIQTESINPLAFYSSRMALTIGGIGQAMFTSRFIYQWLVSEKQKESILPVGFWLLSISGSALLLVYSLLRSDPVIFIGQCVGFFIYSRNLILLWKEKNREKL